MTTQPSARARRPRRRLAALGVVALLAAGAGCVVDLGTPDGFVTSVGVDVTADGTVVATAYTADERREAAVRGTDGEWTLLGTAFSGESAWSEASAANADGMVVGTSGNGASDIAQVEARAFAWDEAGGFRTLPIDLPGRPYVTAVDVNDSGQVLGTASSSVAAQDVVGYIYTPGGALTILPAGGATAAPAAFNNDGTAVGVVGSFGGTGGGVYHAVEWAPPDYEPVTLPVPGASRYNAATDIDEDGTVAGWWMSLYPSEPGGTVKHVGLVWSGGAVSAELPGLVSIGGIEDGSVVGAVERPAAEGGGVVAAVWRLGEEEPERLGTLGGTSSATAIRQGRVVGTAEVGDGGWLSRHAVRF